MLTETGTIIREFETEHFHVIADAVEEVDLDLSWDENGSTRDGLENGSLVAFCARVRVILKDTDQVVGHDYLGNCIYKSLSDFEDHRACGLQNRKRIKQDGRFQIYRKNRPYQHCLSNSDKLKPRGLATREKAEQWAKLNAKEEYEVFETGKCGSYFAGMIGEAIKEARAYLVREKALLNGLYVRQ
jgi:hypothetical protein